jgi:hypothetical protein
MAPRDRAPQYLDIKPVLAGGAGDIARTPPTGNPMLPTKEFRACVIGASGCGKSQLVANLIMRGWLSFDRIVLCLKVPDQDVYEELARHIKEVAAAAADDDDDDDTAAADPDDLFKIVTSVAELKDAVPLDPPPSAGAARGKTLLVFDDFVTEGRKENEDIGKYFSRGRHKGVSCMYLTQDFYGVPLMVRRNCNYFFVFGTLDEDDLSRIHRKLGNWLSRKEFMQVYHEATADRYSFLTIDTDTNLAPLKFRKGLDTVYLR